MRVSILLHDREANESFKVIVITSDDPATLKEAARKRVERLMDDTRQVTGFEDPDEDGSERSGLERKEHYDPMPVDEAWQMFDPTGYDVVHWELHTGSESYRIMAYADKHEIVKTLDARVVIASSSSHPIDV